MSDIYIISGRVSHLPCFWQARYGDLCVEQIDETGEPVRRRAELSPDGLTYWGVVTKFGSFGFDIQNQKVVFGATGLNPRSELCGELDYSRHMVIDTNGLNLTTSVTVSLGNHKLRVIFHPSFAVEYIDETEKQVGAEDKAKDILAENSEGMKGNPECY